MNNDSLETYQVESDYTFERYYLAI